MFLGFGSNVIRGMIFIFGTLSIIFSFSYFAFVFSDPLFYEEIETGVYVYLVLTINGLLGITYLVQGILSFVRREASRKIISKTVFALLIVSVLILAYLLTIPEEIRQDDVNLALFAIVMDFVFWRIFKDKDAIKYFNRVTQ